MQTLKNDNTWKNVVFACSSIDAAVESISIINRELGLYTITNAGIKNAMSKERMTNKWSDLKILNRFSKTYIDFDISISVLNNNFDLIIKPNKSALYFFYDFPFGKTIKKYVI